MPLHGSQPEKDLVGRPGLLHERWRASSRNRLGGKTSPGLLEGTVLLFFNLNLFNYYYFVLRLEMNHLNRIFGSDSTDFKMASILRSHVA